MYERLSQNNTVCAVLSKRRPCFVSIMSMHFNNIWMQTSVDATNTNRHSPLRNISIIV